LATFASSASRAAGGNGSVAANTSPIFRRFFGVHRSRVLRRRDVPACILRPAGSDASLRLSITTYLANGGTLEHARQIAAHASPKTTKLYDRTHNVISLDEMNAS
jgi:hypothetical protein